MLMSLSQVPGRLLVLTLGRLVFVPIIIVSFDVAPLVTTLALAIFVAADLYDGVLARELHADGTARRVLDTVVDRLSIYPVYIFVTALGYLPVALLAVFGLREFFCAYWCQRLLRLRDVAIRADWMYRTLNLMLAGWVVVAPFANSEARAGLFVLLLMFSAIVATDLKRSVQVVLEMPVAVRSRVLPAGYLRTRHRGHGATDPQSTTGALRSA